MVTSLTKEAMPVIRYRTRDLHVPPTGPIYGDHVDERVKPQDPAMVAMAIAPDYALGAHTASLGLCWAS